ncbi:MAG: hypothetical protein HYX42_00700 [Polaromonas sp.]|uniref:hypothetical protein n=1 Tax=Polaromonas sp. TaxID=1869339 RepID=UPI0025E3532E|nr:hypothetical protein [Polaromonas sp.]MBI2724745.1 hypothetical protein [Polaromonas sp.]
MIKKLLTVAAAALFCVSANAGYAQLKPPPGWSPGGYAPAANDASFGRIIFSPNGPTATVGGQAVKMPAAYRLAANAPRIAAAAIFANPYVRVGAAIATWLGVAKVAYDIGSGSWISTAPNPETSCNLSGGDQSAYESWLGSLGGNGAYDVAHRVTPWKKIVNDKCQFGATQLARQWDGSDRSTDQVFVQKPMSDHSGPARPLTKEEFERILAPDISTPGSPQMPENVPQELPQPTPLPIEQPSPWINPDPGANPQHRPRFVPTGDPQPNPNYDPNAPISPENQPWYQPGVRIVPSPTVSEPWRVDYQPVARPQPTKDPATQPENEPGTKPEDQTEQPDLCEKNPGIVACENGEINDVGLPPIPMLYERKYPEGLTGIWNQKSQQIKQSSTFTLAERLMPTTLTAGACPSWVIPLNFASWASYGEYNVAPPCWIWDVAKTIIIISALMLARSLIFGG